MIRERDDAQVNLQWYTLDELSARELHEVMALRQRVFVVEQRCFYLDADEHDLEALHAIARRPSGALVAYLRAYTAVSEAYLERCQRLSFKVGRVVVPPEARGRGWGARLMRSAEAELARRGAHEIQLAAQVSALGFYERLGYEAYGEVFLDAEIPHQWMKLELMSVEPSGEA